MPPASRTLHAVINELVDRTNTDMQRLRVLEQRTGIMSSRINAIEKDLFRLREDLQNNLAKTEREFSRTQDRLAQIENTIAEIVKRVKKAASSSEVREVKALVEIYNPLKSNFITKEEALELLKKNNK